MQLIRGLDKVLQFSAGTVASIGNFDGVHCGHKALLSVLRLRAAQLNLPLVVMVFEPQPSEFFYGQNAPARLMSLREKVQALRACGVDYVYCLKFNKNIASMSAYDFAEKFIFRLLRVRYLLLGKDFHFGCQRLGDVDFLQAWSRQRECVVEAHHDFLLDDKRVSSTLVRNALQTGELATAARLLGRHYSLSGRVIYGDARARRWGFPTVNIKIRRRVLPLRGVFCVQAIRADGALLTGVANVGTRPTVDGLKTLLEIHFFDFNETLYGERLEVFFMHKLRDEKKFDSVELLVAQIHEDAAQAALYFREL